MIKKILVAVLFSFPFLLYSQNHPLVKEGGIWMESLSYGLPNPIAIRTQYANLLDIIISGGVYKK